MVFYFMSEAGAPFSRGDTSVDRIDKQTGRPSDGEAGSVLIKEAQCFIISSAAH